MPRMLRWMKKEAVSVVPGLIYFLLAFNILHYSSVLMMGPEQVRYTSYLGATIGAIVAAKVILIVRNLPYINLFPKKPMIYNILWKFLIYSVVVILVQMLDFMAHQIHQHHGLELDFQGMIQELMKPHFWGVQIWVLFLFLIYVTVSEFNLVLGPLALRKMMFG